MQQLQYATDKTQHSLALSSFPEADQLMQVPSPESDNATAYIYYWVFRKYSGTHQTVRSIHYLELPKWYHLLPLSSNEYSLLILQRYDLSLLPDIGKIIFIQGYF